MWRFCLKMSMAFISVTMISLASARANGQQAAGSASWVSERDAQRDAAFPGKQELLRRIALYEAAEQSAERTHPGLESMVKIYGNLAALYEDADMFAKSQVTMRREISMLRSGPQDELADAIG